MVKPGEVCDNCGRRQPYPKRPDSPKSVMVSYRAPSKEEADIQKDVEDSVIDYLGLNGSKFIRFKIHSLAPALILQDPTLKGFFSGR